MQDYVHALMIWSHVLGIALYVGPQFFLAFAWVPASRNIADLPTRVQAMRTITSRFAAIGGAGLALIFVSGTYLISTWRTHYGIPDDVGFTDQPYGHVFIGKMILLVIMVGVVGLHTFSTGPQLLEATEATIKGGPAEEARVKRLRKQSMLLSISGLILVLLIMSMGSLLSTKSITFD